MSENTVHFSGRMRAEQVPNGVQTGLESAYVFDLLKETVSSWSERSRLDAVLLQALITLSAKNSADAEAGFTAQDIAEQMRLITGRGWATADPNEVVADKVRRLWKQLIEKLWPQKIEGITQLILDKGGKELPVLDRVEGGGTGRPTRYRIKIEAIPQPLVETTLSASASNPQADIHYICEDLEDAGPIARFFSRGFRIIGWRRWAFAVMLAFAFLVAIIALSLLLSILVEPNMRQNMLYWLVVLGVFSWAGWTTVGCILTLPETRIGAAPWWIQLGETDRLVEWRCPPRYPNKEIKAARYTAVCPVCAGKVSVKPGGIRLWQRLVGRCQESPQEHVFSFDHVTRNGKRLC